MPPVRLDRLGEEVEDIAVMQLATAGDRYDATDMG